MRRLIVVVVMAAFAAMMLVGCDTSSQPSINQQSRNSAAQRAETLAKAQSLYPAPIMKNFPLRKALVDLTAREDEVNHPWYVYIQSQMSGQVIGYYVAKTAPQSECNTLSSTESVYQSDNGNVILSAPTLNGEYAGGAGASGTCDTYFFNDESTDAMIEITGDSFFVVDQPLTLNVPAFKVAK